MIFDENTVIELIKSNQQQADWVLDARSKMATLNALVYGINFHKELIEHIEHIESEKKSRARKKYSKDIRDVYARILSKRNNVFEASGGSENINVKNEKVKSLFNNYSSKFKYNKSLFQYLSEYYFKLLDTDPNGVLFIEYETKEEESPKLEATYKCINDIRNYECNGQILEWIVFEPKNIFDANINVWRVVDDKTDWTINENNGLFVVDYEKTFTHPFGKVPAVILSPTESVGSELRESPIEPIIEVSKDLARDKSILTIYKFQNGFPIHWRFVTQCRSCAGTGKTGDSTCKSCDGKGFLMKTDVTDLVTLPIPQQDQPNIAPNIAGFISPDLETWRQYKEDILQLENKMHDTFWGTETAVKSTKTSQKTATEAYIDVQPVTNVLNKLSSTVEYIHNTLANFILNFVDQTKTKDEKLYNITYGRRYILESPDVILDRYQKSKLSGDNNTILDKILEEFVMSKYKNDPNMQELMSKKIKCEPYVHLDIKTINDIFGSKEAMKKVLFQKFWETTDTTKKINEININFLDYFKDESSKIVQMPTT